MNFLTLVPKKVLLVLGGAIFTTMVIFTAYSKGVEAERTRQELAQEFLIKEEIERGLIEAQQELEEALKSQKEKEAIISTLNSQLNTSESQSNELQELLNDVLSQPTTECDRMPEPSFRLYKNMYNKRPSD